MRRLILAVLIISVLLFGACSAPPTPARVSTPAPAPTSELELYEAYKAIETRLDGMAMNSEAQRYLADFMDLTDGMWQINYVQEHKGYYVRIQQLRDSHPNTYYYKSYWRDTLWYLDSDGHISPDANARRIEADLFDLSAGGFIEPNPNFYEAELIIPAPTPTTPVIADAPASLSTADVNLAPYRKVEEFHNPKYLATTEGCIHASIAFALAEGQILKLTLESDCPISWDAPRSWENPRSEIGVVFAEMRTYIEGEGWVTISTGAKEVKQVSSSNGGRQFDIVLTPADIVGCGFEPPGTGIYKLLALNLDPNNSHYLKYNISETPLTAPRLVTPHNGATGVELTASLVWQPVPNAKGYELIIAHNYDFSDIYRSGSTSLTSYQFTDEELEPHSRYYWMVVAKMNPADPNTPVAYSEVWTFTTTSALTPEPATISSAYITSSDITSEPSAYDGKEVEMLGQTYLKGSGPRLLVDSKSGVNIAGSTAGLQRGFYRLRGKYDAGTNTLTGTEFKEEEVKYRTIETGKELGVDFVPVSIQGLIATTPKEVANTLTSYISIPHLPENIPIYPYVVYTRDGFYLVLSDTLVSLPAEFKFLYEGKDYSFTFSAGWVDGTLVKTPLKEINFGPEWQPDEFGGVIIANSISSFTPLNTTVEQVNAEPDEYAFNRVSVTASYLVTTATLDYSDIKAPMGQGVLAETFTDFFGENSKKRLETIDPERKVWQLRECQVTGTIIYPTEEILKYLDYSAPLSKSEVIERLKPVLIVDTIVDEEVQVANISELNPIVGNPSRYWGKVVQFEGYALGINYPLKTLVKAVTARDIPVNVNLLAVGIADDPAVGSQLAIIGLNNDLIGEQGEIIKGKYKFKVAVTHMPEELVSGVPGADTAFFLLSKEELPMEIPKTELYSLNISINPSGAGSVALTPPGVSYPSGMLVTLTAFPAVGYAFGHWSGDASGTSLNTTITVDSDKAITAHFKRIL